MTIRYVLLELGTDYNDETYSIGGDDAKILKDSYATAEEAQASLKKQLRVSLKDFDLRDFEEYYSGPLKRGYLEEVYNDEWHYGATWEEFIEWCEKANLDWYREAPKLLQVFEIEV